LILARVSGSRAHFVITARYVAFIGDENTSRAPANLEWMEQHAKASQFQTIYIA
jgi:hypothetical protein